MKKSDIKMYEGTYKETLTKMLADGIRPLTLKEITFAKKKGWVEKRWYSSANFFIKETGELVIASPVIMRKWLKNPSYGRFLWLDDNGLGGYLNLNARFLGVAAELPKKVQK